MPEIRPGCYARHPELGTVKVLHVLGSEAEIEDDIDSSLIVSLASLTLDPIDAAEQAADNA
jgi:hypothetical protein